MAEKKTQVGTGHGGARTGAGRPKVRLEDLLLDGTFRWKNHRHRRALLTDLAPLDLGDDEWATQVCELVERYRRSPHRPNGHWSAQLIEGLVRDES